jgi:ABC-type sugar transport systems, permease components
MTTGTLAARRTTGFARLRSPRRRHLAAARPCLLYLAAFAIYPLIYSLRLSFTDLTAADGTGRWVGLKNYGDLLVDPLFWNAT